jgi:nitrogen regulatory protein PII
MKKIETVLRRFELKSFSRCAKQLGVLGFDLSENNDSPRKGGHHDLVQAIIDDESFIKVKVTFAVLDREAKDTVYAILKRVHPDSIAIFQMEKESSR